jgi:hypothetical protein
MSSALKKKGLTHVCLEFAKNDLKIIQTSEKDYFEKKRVHAKGFNYISEEKT